MLHSITLHIDSSHWETFGFYKLTACGLVCLFFIVISRAAVAENIVLRESFAGNMTFTVFGNTMRTGCSNLGSSSSSMSIPSGSTIKAAYLYWSGSGNSDNTVIFDGNSVTASIGKRYSETVDGNNFYSNRADVTNLVNSNKSYTVSGLNFNTRRRYCNSGQAYGGWAVVVVYENSSEPLRVVNIFDGFRDFRGSSITLTPNNFVIADNPATKGGLHAHITWEGDSGNSQSINGISESLTFNGQTLFEPGTNPLNNQFNSYSNTTGQVTDGVDLDIYEIGNLLGSGGGTSVSTTYSTGQDRVFLSAEILSIPNREVADLKISATNGGSFLKGSEASVTFNVTNAGPSTSNNPVVTLPLADNLVFSGLSGSNWSCSATTTLVTCNYLAALPKNSSTTLTINFSSESITKNSITLTGTVASSTFDNHAENNKAVATLQFLDPDFSTSIKRLIDLNGGNIAPGDQIRFEIELINSVAADVPAATLVDHMPALISDFSLVSSPADSQVSIQKNPNGNFGQGVVTVTDIFIAANSTATVLIDATISANAQNGDSLTNTATVSIGSYSHNITSPTATVSTSSTVQGNKPLYLHNNLELTRVASTDTTSFQEITDGSTISWQLAPALKKELTLDYSTAIPIQLFLRNGYDGSDGFYEHTITVTLFRGATVIASGTFTAELVTAGNTNPNLQTIRKINQTLTVQNPVGLNIGETLKLSITQNGSYYGDPMDVFFSLNGKPSFFALTATSVINIDDIRLATESGGSEHSATFERGQTHYIQTVVSDPFGAYDITKASLVITDPNGTTILPSTTMTEISASGANKTYEYSYLFPADATKGNWRISVLAQEGFEGIVSHSQDAFFLVQLYPQISLTKSSHVINDPVNGTNNPKAIPGAEVVYELLALNSGEGRPDIDTLIMDEEIPNGMPLFVGDLAAGSPVIFSDGAAPDGSGLTFNFSSLTAANDDLAFSNNQGTTFDYQPSPDAEGYDSNVTNIRFMPKGHLKEADNTQPQFKFQYKVKVQ